MYMVTIYRYVVTIRRYMVTIRRYVVTIYRYLVTIPLYHYMYISKLKTSHIHSKIEAILKRKLCTVQNIPIISICTEFTFGVNRKHSHSHC